MGVRQSTSAGSQLQHVGALGHDRLPGFKPGKYPHPGAIAKANLDGTFLKEILTFPNKDDRLS
ncbi:MAG: hypothetical protein PHI67_08095, partial [Candidatus Methanomethylophilaceae archaeon]|nr:hypothetical protein [Candidatus Methanomethylophilaceae archaeon]